MELTFNILNAEEQAKTLELAKSCAARLAKGEGVWDVDLRELTAYAIMRELDLSVALSEIVRRTEGGGGLPDAKTVYV